MVFHIMSLVIPIFLGGGEGGIGSLNFWGGGGGSEKRVCRF